MKLSNEDKALLQARHLYNEMHIEEVTHGGGFTIGKDTLTIKVNRLAWGYFEQSILRAFKNREDLQQRNQHLFYDDVECAECKGVGKFPFVGEEYDKALKEWNEDMKEGDYFYCKPGTPLGRPCSPCQSTGIQLKKQGK